MKDFRSDLSDELSALAPPPLGDVIGAATRRGRRARKARLIGAATGSALALAGVVALLGGSLNATGPAALQVSAAAAPGLASGPAPSPAAGTGSATPGPSGSSGARPVTTADPGKVPTTGAALLSALLRVLPQDAKTSGYAGENASTNGRSVDSTVAQTYLTTPAGTGMIRVFLGTASPDTVCTTATSCYRDKLGQQVFVNHMKGNCIQNTVVEVVHADGTAVQVNVSSCLAWDGHGNKPGILALTEEQAVAVAGDPALDNQSTPAAVAAAAAQFPDLPHLTS